MQLPMTANRYNQGYIEDNDGKLVNHLKILSAQAVFQQTPT